jgi:hypothetical protein
MLVKTPNSLLYILLFSIFLKSLISTLHGIRDAATSYSTETYQRAKAIADNFKHATSVEM